MNWLQRVLWFIRPSGGTGPSVYIVYLSGLRDRCPAVAVASRAPAVVVRDRVPVPALLNRVPAVVPRDRRPAIALYDRLPVVTIHVRS